MTMFSRLLAASTVGGIILGIYFVGFIPPVVGIAILALAFLGAKLIRNFIRKRAEKKAFEMGDLASTAPNEQAAFNAGLAAEKSYRGYFNAWTIKSTYSNYFSYAAGKYCAQQRRPHARYEYR